MRRLPNRIASRLLAAALASAGLAACTHIIPIPIEAEVEADTLEARSLDESGLRAFVERELGANAADWPPQRLGLDTATLVALYFQPSLDIARAQRDVARGGIATAGQRPNPSISIAPERSANPGTAVSPWLAAVRLDWPIETAHKRDHRIARADALASSAERALTVEAWRIHRDLRLSFVATEAGRRRLSLLRNRSDTERRLVDLLEQRVVAGSASRAESMPGRLAWMTTRAELADAERNYGTARAQLAAAMGIPLRALDGIEVEYDLESVDDPSDQLDDARARRHALLKRADVLAALDSYAASEAQLRLELAKQWPDLRLGSGYQFDEGQNKWGLGLSLDLPVMNRNEGPIEEAVAAREEAAARFTAIQAQVIADLDQATAQRSGAREQLRRVGALVSEQRRAWDRARTSFVQGATDRLALLAAEVELRRSEGIELDAQVALEIARTQLEAALQGPLTAAGSIGQSPRPARAQATP